MAVVVVAGSRGLARERRREHVVPSLTVRTHLPVPPVILDGEFRGASLHRNRTLLDSTRLHRNPYPAPTTCFIGKKRAEVLDLDGGQGRSRTTDTRIFSPLLYQLSYLAALWEPGANPEGARIKSTVGQGVKRQRQRAQRQRQRVDSVSDAVGRSCAGRPLIAARAAPGSPRRLRPGMHRVRKGASNRRPRAPAAIRPAGDARKPARYNPS